jgi:pentose-5-phosphate-3-epimerase
MNKLLVAPSIIALDFAKPGDEITTCDSAARGMIRFWARRSA